MDILLHRALLLVVTLTTAVSSDTHTDYLNKNNRSESRDWGPWTSWSLCSETCGYGVAYRIRQCHAHYYRDRNNIQCQGQTKQYKICLLKNCTHSTPDYRTTECSKHNHVYYGQRTYTWIPYINSVSPCELSCKSSGYGYYARFQKTVADFVICDEGNSAVCIQGQCVKSGCDGILGSGSRPDQCGVCGGDDSSCRLIRGIFTRAYLSHQGYNLITTIPAGARNINITELSRSGNHLALSTSSGYFLNGNMRLQAEGNIQGAGTLFMYNKANSQTCPGECLTSPGPLEISLIVELIYFSRNPGVYYHFTISKEGTRNVINSIKSNDNGAQQDRESNHQHNADKSTTKAYIIPRITPGKYPVYFPDIETTNSPHPLHLSNQVRSPKTSSNNQPSEISSKSDSDVHKPKYQHIFETTEETLLHKKLNKKQRQSASDDAVKDGWQQPDPYDSIPHDLSELDESHYQVAGNNGSVEYKHYYHTNEHDDIGDVPMAAPLDDDDDDKQTNGIRKGVPPSWLPSNSIDRYAEFRSTVQHQQLPDRYSQLQRNSLSSKQNNDVLSQSSGKRDYNGFDNRLTSHDSHRRLYSWRITGLTACSEPCGGGLQETKVACVKGDSQVEVIAENCIENLKPQSTTIVCNNQPCEPKWELNQWDACSVTCGHGLQKRFVICKQRISPTLSIEVSSTACPQPQPPSRQFCQLGPCFTWKVSEWTKCSSECGFGQRTRTASCANSTGQAVQASLCSQLKPVEEEICDMGSCAQGWFHSKWSQHCSSECGRGHYSRDVVCSAADGSRLDEKKCGGKKKKPREWKVCKATRPCGGLWFTGPWSQCSATCGSNAHRRRNVLCIKHHGKTINQVVKEHNCVKEDKPAQTEPCGLLPDCKPQWFVAAWSECSEACGTGVKTRDVKCLDSTMSPSPDCEKSLKPSRRLPCNLQPCPEKYTEASQNSETATNEALQMDGSMSSDEHACKDNQSSQWCVLVKQARLCLYFHYRKICCHTCRKLDPKHH